MSKCLHKHFYLLLFSTIGFTILGQENEIGLRLSYARMDAFSGMHYTRAFSRFKEDVAFEWGVNRSYLQHRFFPRLTFSSSFSVIDKKLFKLAPLASYGYALLKTNYLNNRFHYWHEIYGGFNIEVGSKWKGIITFSGGWLMEQYFNSYVNSTSFTHTLGFNGSASLVFCW